MTKTNIYSKCISILNNKRWRCILTSAVIFFLVSFTWLKVNIYDESFYRTVLLPEELKSEELEKDLSNYSITYYLKDRDLDTSKAAVFVKLESTYGKASEICKDENLFPLKQEIFVTTESSVVKNVDDLLAEERAVTYKGKYINDDDYGFIKTIYARCTFPSSYLEKKLYPVLEKHFKFTPVKKPELCFISAVGDILMERGIDDILLNDENGVKKVFTTTLPLLHDADYTIGNLECPATERGTRAKKTYTFRFRPAALQGLKDAGFDYLMFTNNHCFDYGMEGFTDTIEALKKYGFGTSGIGYNMQEARKFHHTEVKGLKLSILSFSAFPTERSGFDGRNIVPTEDRAGALWYPDDIEQMVKEEKDAGYFVIICVHAGFEYVTKPSATQEKLYHALCDSGADIVLGSHPHVLQKVENYKSSCIAYSLGNFVFPGMDEMPGATDTTVIQFGIMDGKIIYQKCYPSKIVNTSVKLKQF